MRVRIVASAIALVALAAACDATAPNDFDITATTQGAAFVAPGEVVVLIRNDTDETITTECLSLERHVGDAWTHIPLGPCVAIQIEIAAGVALSLSVQIPADAVSGALRTNPFDVTGRGYGSLISRPSSA